jgi:hypothetical protein
MRLISKSKKLRRKQLAILSIGTLVSVVLIISLLIIFRHVHSFGEWEKVRDATCSQYGLEQRFCECGKVQEKKHDKTPHLESELMYDADKNIQKTVCISCGKTLSVNSLEGHTHSWSEYTITKEATCTEKGESIRHCECLATDILIHSAKGHNFGKWTVDLAPQCEVDGLQKRVCSDCGEYESEIIPMLSHIEGNWIVSNNEKQILCTYCKKVLQTEELIFSEYLHISNGLVIDIGTCEDTVLCIQGNYNNQNVTAIDASAFMFSTIEGAILPDSIIRIESNAFYQCFDLENIHLGSGLTFIGQKAFYKCKSLKIIALPESVTTIENYAFASCSNLEVVYLGSNITKLNMRIFEYCVNLKEIHFNGTVNDWLALEKDDEWDLGTSNYTIYCIDGTIEK